MLYLRLFFDIARPPSWRHFGLKQQPIIMFVGPKDGAGKYVVRGGTLGAFYGFHCWKNAGNSSEGHGSFLLMLCGASG